LRREVKRREEKERDVDFFTYGEEEKEEEEEEEEMRSVCCEIRDSRLLLGRFTDE
jgi:hypothetical protein